MINLTLLQLQCFQAVVNGGTFQVAAGALGRTQPTVSLAVKNLEDQLEFQLFDRSGYRVSLTEAGRSFHLKSASLLRELSALKTHASQLRMGEETDLHIVIGDLCSLPETLALLRRFFDACPGTKLHLHFEAITGPLERLLENEADMVLHHIDKSDQRLEYIDLFTVTLVPVVAPGFLAFSITDSLHPEDMRNYVQCVIRDSARNSAVPSFYLIDGARSWTVADQLMKKELILQGMGWGHLPTYLIKDELGSGRLQSIAGSHFKGGKVDLVAARRQDKTHGPIANRLWRFISEHSTFSAFP
jgi:DNA-binding transcriptional LysR family regulator